MIKCHTRKNRIESKRKRNAVGKRHLPHFIKFLYSEFHFIIHGISFSFSKSEAEYFLNYRQLGFYESILRKASYVQKYQESCKRNYQGICHQQLFHLKTLLLIYLFHGNSSVFVNVSLQACPSR